MMKFWNGRRGAGGEGGAVAEGGGEGRIAHMRRSSWFKATVSVGGVFLVIVLCVEVYGRVERYGTRLVERHPVPAYLEVREAPTWMDPRIVASLRDEGIAFATRDEETFNRAQNVLDTDILREIAALYTGSGPAGGQAASRQAVGFNAWIKRVTEVRRDVAPDQSRQTIALYAEWRQPAAWVRSGDMLCLVDAEGVRLPGDYPLQDRAGSGLMVISGVALPAGGETGAAVPAPGQVWGSGGRMGDDLAAGMALINVLRGQRYCDQIDAVDVSNYGGRADARDAWIVLATAWPASSGGPRVVQWGRPVGQEKVFEVQAAAKLKVLNEIYLRYNRIDAGRDYVDIRTELVKVPKLAGAEDAPRQVR